MNKNFKSNILISIVLALFIAISCNKTDGSDNLKQTGLAKVQVRIGGNVSKIKKKLIVPASANLAKQQVLPSVQTNTISLNDEFDLITELIEDQGGDDMANSVGPKPASATIMKTALGSNIKYKVVVYDHSGAFVTERNYIHGQEDKEKALELNRGETYTFIAISENSTSALAPIEHKDINHPTLANTFVGIAVQEGDLMYFKQEMTLHAEKNVLDINLKHQFSQIAVSLDAKSTGDYRITAINANISQKNERLEMYLLDGRLHYIGREVPVPLNFSNIGTQNILSKPIVINGSGQNININIASIAIGPLTQSNITVPILKIMPGVKYQLKLTISHKDGNVTHEGIWASRINGKIWMQYNLGAQNFTDPHVGTQAIHGNYYQWGSPKVVGSPTSTTVNKDWDGNNAPGDNYWNHGTELTL